MNNGLLWYFHIWLSQRSLFHLAAFKTSEWIFLWWRDKVPEHPWIVKRGILYLPCLRIQWIPLRTILNKCGSFFVWIEDLLRHNKKESNDFSGGLIFLRAGCISNIMRSGVERSIGSEFPSPVSIESLTNGKTHRIEGRKWQWNISLSPGVWYPR